MLWWSPGLKALCINAGLYLACLWLPVQRSHGHAAVLSNYVLRWENNQWVLEVTKKTSQFRDALYRSNDDLRGQNLNSKGFIKRAGEHISRRFRLIHEEKTLSLTPIDATFDGLLFNASFSVEDLPSHPKTLSVHATDFDDHEHSVNTLIIEMGADGYVKSFNTRDRHAIFSFESKTYSTPATVVESTADQLWLRKQQWVLSILAVIIALAVVTIKVASPKKTVSG